MVFKSPMYDSGSKIYEVSRPQPVASDACVVVKHCSNCGRYIENQHLYCPNCGTKVERNRPLAPNQCRYCRSSLGPDESYCFCCGKRRNSQTEIITDN